MGSDFANDKLKTYIEKNFNYSSDFVIREMKFGEQTIIICYYSTLVDAKLMNEQLTNISKYWSEGQIVGESFTSNVEAFHMDSLMEKVCKSNAVVVLPEQNLLMTLEISKDLGRSPDEPKNEQVIRGAHEGFIESADFNISLLRKRIVTPDLVVKSFEFGEEVKTKILIAYIRSKAQEEDVQLVEKKLHDLRSKTITNAGQLQDYMEDGVYSPFPQLLNTERPDRTISNLREGKIAIFTEGTPVTLIGPTSFIAFYQTIDDFNSRAAIGSFYRIIRLAAFFLAILLPSFYIATVSFHPEVLPIELSMKIKLVVNDVPYRPFIEAMVLEIMIELIREAGIRLPAPIGQTIGIVGGLVIGDAIVSAGLVSNIMIIVVALTALSAFVVPSAEMNTAIRLMRFPFMLAAAILGFLGIAIGTLLLFLHLLNLSSFKQPYLSPFIPFQPKEFRKVFFRLPYVTPSRQTDNFKVSIDKKEKET